INTVNTISTWTSLILHFLSNFTIPGGKIFSQLLNGWILCTIRRTVTGILPFADPDGRHGTVGASRGSGCSVPYHRKSLPEYYDYLSVLAKYPRQRNLHIDYSRQFGGWIICDKN